MSLDGFIALEDNSIGHLFDWYAAGDVEVEVEGDLPAFKLTKESADYWRGWTDDVGVLDRRTRRCSTSPTAGRASTRWASPWS